MYEMDNNLQAEILVFQAFLAEAQEKGLQNAALILTGHVAARKQALAKLFALRTADGGTKRGYE
jgi:hypothetical protein